VAGAQPEAPIIFGTDGWRGRIADDFTFARLRAAARAVAERFAAEKPGQALLVGHDRRFLSRQFAEETARVISGAGLPVWLTVGAAPTPALSLAVVRRKLAGAAAITASHNPPEWNGLKLRTGQGAAAPAELTLPIQTRANELLEKGESIPRAAGYQLLDPRPEYLAQVLSLVEVETIRRAELRVVLDVMHGVGPGYADAALQQAGCRVRMLRAEENPGFGGVQPEPIERNLAASLSLTAEPGVDVGFAVDGDADRLGLMAGGRYLSVHQMIALLLYHLAKNRGWKGTVVRTVNTTSMLDRLAEKFGLRLRETPVGFKHVAPLLLDPAEDALLGAEESGGIALRGHIPDREATLAALLLCEFLAVERKPLLALRDDLWGLLGKRYFYRRLDLPLSPQAQEAVLRQLAEAPPRELGGLAVARVNSLDGIKLLLEDGSWVLFRRSGTEPLLRIYLETHSPQALARLEGAARARADQAAP
jgi:phosphomannomutase